MRTLLAILLLALVMPAFGQGTVRRVPTLTKLLTINPYAVGTGDGVVYQVEAPSANSTWGGPRYAVWTPTSALTANGTNVFTSTFGGQWVFLDKDAAIQDARWYGGTNVWSLDDTGALVIGGTNIIGALAATLPDAPMDTQQYARQNGAWTVVVSGTNTVSGSTNASQVKLNSSAYFPIANFLDTSEVAWTNYGGAVYAALKPSSIGLARLSASAVASLESRANHTGTQSWSTISDSADGVWAKVKTSIIGSGNITATADDGAQAVTLHIPSGAAITNAQLYGSTTTYSTFMLSSPGADAAIAGRGYKLLVRDPLTGAVLPMTAAYAMGLLDAAYSTHTHGSFTNLEILATLTVDGALTVGGTNIITALAGKAATSHNHDGSNIVSGYVDVTRLGSGVPTTNAFLRGDGTWAILTTNGSVASSSTNSLSVKGSTATNIIAGPNVDWTVTGLQAAAFIPSGSAITNATLAGATTAEIVTIGATNVVGALAGKANTSHAHSGSDITSGTVAPGYLGSGTPSATKYLGGGGAWVAPVTVNSAEAATWNLEDSSPFSFSVVGSNVHVALATNSLSENYLTSAGSEYFRNRTNHFGTQAISSLQYYTNLVQGTSNNVMGGSNVFTGETRISGVARLTGGLQSSSSATFNTATISNSLQSPYNNDATTFKGGQFAIASANYTTAIGYSPTATGIGGTALGYRPSATNYAIAIGYQPTAAGYSIAQGYLATANGASSVALGRSSAAGGTFAIAIGYNTTAPADQAINIGGNQASGIESLALGVGSYSTGDYGLAIHGTAATYAVSIGESSTAGSHGLSLAWNARATNLYSAAIGPNALNRYSYSTALGYNSVATKDHQIVLGTTGDEIYTPSILVVNTTNITAELASKVGAIHNHDGTNIASGYVPVARLGTGSPTTNTFLRGDGTWASITTNGSTITAPNAIYWDGNYVTNVLSGANVSAALAGQSITVDVNTNKVGLLAADQTWAGSQTFATNVSVGADLNVPSGSLVALVAKMDNLMPLATAIVPDPTNAWVAVFENNPAYNHELMYSAPLSLIKGGDVFTVSNNTFTASNSFASVGISGPLTVGGTNVMSEIDGLKVTLSPSSLHGRGESGGSGSPEQITLGSAFVMTGTRLDLASSDYGDIVVSDGGTAMTIDAGVVSYSKIQNVSATSRLIGRGSASAGSPQELTVSSPLAISGTALTLPDGTVSLAKLANTSTNSVLIGRGAGAAGVPQEITLGTGLTMSGTTLSATAGSGIRAISKKTADFTAANTDEVFICDFTLDGDVTLPTDGSISSGKVITIHRIGGGTITVKDSAGSPVASGTMNAAGSVRSWIYYAPDATWYLVASITGT